MKIVVLGASGTIGRAVVAALSLVGVIDYLTRPGHSSGERAASIAIAGLRPCRCSSRMRS